MLPENAPHRIPTAFRTAPVRFKLNPDGTADGGVHDIFTITGLGGAEGCILKQPNFAPRRNIIFRIPTPTFGGGLIEQIPDQTIIDNQTVRISHRYGVRGKLNIVNAGHTIAVRENRNGNDGTIARFGWKAQNKSLLVFLARHTMSKWVSPMNCFKRNEMRHLRVKRLPRPTIRPIPI